MTWLGFKSRMEGAWHILRGHEVHWHDDVEELCPHGDIVCHTCNMTIWCRSVEEDIDETSR